MKYLIFDVESVPNGELLAAVKYRGMQLGPHKAIALAESEAIREHGSSFIPYTYQTPATVAVMCVDDRFACQECLIIPGDTTGRLTDRSMVSHQFLQRLTTEFWRYVEEAQHLVSFNGRGFDVPLLELCSFSCGVPIQKHLTSKYGARYRFGDSHIDLMEFMTNFGATRLAGGLNLLSALLGRRGKGEVDGSRVAELFKSGRHLELDAYCLSDVLETYCVFLRTRVMTGELTAEAESRLIAEASSMVSLRITALQG